uniref:Uncharacterized protein n=2 Tax=Phytophthora fragariae TaxID=53985 RepID=A0A6A3F8G4_9STRA|nr:hypothetical protein PF009_g10111 [Phytophthora fragariae]
MLSAKALAKQELERQYADFIARRETEQMFTSPEEAVKFLNDKAAQSDSAGNISPVGVDMLLIDKEKFHGGWNLWLAAKNRRPIGADEINKILAMKYRGESPTTFRLSVWDNPNRRLDRVDPESIPIGSEIVAESVTGLRVYRGQVAQGNTSGVTVVENDSSVHPYIADGRPPDGGDHYGGLPTRPTISKPADTVIANASKRQNRKSRPTTNSSLHSYAPSESDASYEVLEADEKARAPPSSASQSRAATFSRKARINPPVYPAFSDDSSSGLDSPHENVTLDELKKKPTELRRRVVPKRKTEPKRKPPSNVKNDKKQKAEPEPEEMFKPYGNLPLSPQKRKY